MGFFGDALDFVRDAGDTILSNAGALPIPGAGLLEAGYEAADEALTGGDDRSTASTRGTTSLVDTAPVVEPAPRYTTTSRVPYPSPFADGGWGGQFQLPGGAQVDFGVDPEGDTSSEAGQLPEWVGPAAMVGGPLLAVLLIKAFD